MKQFIAIALLFLSLQASAQAPSTVSRDYISNIVSWNKLALSGKLYQKLNYQIDFEYRRQADPAHSSEPSTTVGNSKSNLFKNPFQYASRVWLHYQADKSFTFSISPIAWFGTWTAPVNNIATFQPEYRSSLQITSTQNIGRLALQHRYRYDLRFMGLKSNDETDLLLGPAASYHFEKASIQSRFRYMLRAVMPINNTKVETGTYYTYSHAEIFIKTGESIKNINLLDQFRSAIGLGYKCKNDIRLELGYMNILSYRFNNKAQNNIDLLHSVCLSILFDDFQGLFKNNAIATQ